MTSDTQPKIKQPKKNVISGLFYAIVGWPHIDIEHAKAVEAIKRFMFFGKLLLVYQPHPNADHPIMLSKRFLLLSFTIDLFTLLTVIRLICCFFTDNLLTLAYLGDIFVGKRNEYALRMLSVCCVACLGGFRAVSCYLARKGSLDWTKVIDKAMINGWKPEILNMKKAYCLKWRQTSVFIARQIVGASLIVASIWVTCFLYLMFSSTAFYLALKSPLVISLYTFWQVIALSAIIWFVPQATWIGFLYGIAFFYVINKSNSIYSELQTSLKLKYIRSSALRKLCNLNISFLNEFDHINCMMRYIAYAAYNLISVTGQVAMLYSYLGLFGMPLADLSLGIIGCNTIFQVGLSSFLAAKSVAKIGLSYSHYHRIYQNNYNIEPRIKLKLLYNLDRLNDPSVGFWVGESFINDNYAFIQYLFETCSNMMLIIVTMSSFIWQD
uniref:Gustatory receptor n=1 Tax=Tetranychus urticae TaxID=32264 RepID=T1K0T6_TETUR